MMAPKKLKRSTDYSLEFLNSINTPRHNAEGAKDPKRRRTTHAEVYSFPLSPSPTQSQKAPRTEPRNTSRLSLRNRRIHRHAPYGLSENEEDQGASNGESGSEDSESESDDNESLLEQDGPNENEARPRDEYHKELQREVEEDPFPDPVDLFPAEDDNQSQNQAGSQLGNRAEDVSDAESGDDYSDDENQAGSQEGKEEAKNTSDDESRNEHSDEVENPTERFVPADVEVQSTSNKHIAYSNTVEVQIFESASKNQRGHLRTSRVSPDVQGSQNLASQLQGVPETPTIQPPQADQDHQSARSDIFTWLTETTKESGFKETWEAIRRTRKTLKTYADPSMKERFGDIIKLIGRLRGVFQTMTDDPTSASSLKHQCSLIANNIFKEAQWIIYTEAPEDEEEGAYLVNQLEAHIVPRLIELTLSGFKTYTIINDRVARHFRIILDVLWGCCDRISSLAEMQYEISMSVMAHSKRLMPHVKNIKDALKDGRLRQQPHRMPRRPPSYKHFGLDEVDGHISCGRWSYAERAALRDGLQLYEGKTFGPYVRFYVNVIYRGR